MVQLRVTCVLCALGLAFKTPLFCVLFLSTLKCDNEILTYMLACLDCEERLLFKTIHMKKNKTKHSYTVEATIEFALNHSTTVTWV